ncbi:DUF6470 family protein [Bacillus sp. JJ1566]|uniref:DUF6470 family protein n=1 Tax=Bacillus sp. JJ1566 TaxID=3122961 RepID=UPI002FFE4341
MILPQIRLESKQAQIGIETTSARTETEQPKAELSIQQPKADISMETTPPKLTIDQTEAWADMGLKNILRSIEELAQKGKEDTLVGIARRVQQGTELMEIENGGNPLVRQAQENGQKPMKEFNIGFIPSFGSVKIHYEPGKVDIKATPHKPIIDVQVNKPIVDYFHGKVDTYLRQRNELKIDFEYIDTKA